MAVLAARPGRPERRRRRVRPRRPRAQQPRLSPKRCHLRCRALDGQDPSGPAPAAPCEDRDARVSRQPASPVQPAVHTTPFERHVFRVTAAVTLIRPESDKDLHLVLSDGRRTMIAETPTGVLRRPRNPCGSETDGPGASCGTPLRKGNHHRCRLLRLLPRPNRCCPKRDRAPSRSRLHLSIKADPSAFTSPCASSRSPAAARPPPPPPAPQPPPPPPPPSNCAAVLPRRLHPTAATRPQLRRHPLPQLPRHLQRPRPRPTPLRRRPRWCRLRELTPRHASYRH